jgi:predicted nuclease of predicted toxin-antitoxin system
VKLLLDVNLPRLLVSALRSAGWEAERVTEHLEATALDEEILALAAERGSVVVTRDQDFSFLASRPGRTEPSVINLRLSAVEVEELNRILDGIFRAHAEDLERGAILSVTDSGVRVRRLPVQ